MTSHRSRHAARAAASCAALSRTIFATSRSRASFAHACTSALRRRMRSHAVVLVSSRFVRLGDKVRRVRTAAERRGGLVGARGGRGGGVTSSRRLRVPALAKEPLAPRRLSREERQRQRHASHVFLSRRRNRRRVSFTNSLHVRPPRRQRGGVHLPNHEHRGVVRALRLRESRLVFRRDRLRLDATPLRRRRHTRVPHRRSVIILARTNPVAPSVRRDRRRW